MTKYQAIFPNGAAITRKSERVYTHAWAAFRTDGKLIEKGFSSTMELAWKAADAYAARCVKWQMAASVTIQVVEVTK